MKAEFEEKVFEIAANNELAQQRARTSRSWLYVQKDSSDS